MSDAEFEPHRSKRQRPPWGLAWRSHDRFIISTVGMGMFTDMVLYGLIVPVLPFLLEDRLHMPQGSVQSSVSNLLAAYAGASVVSSPIAGFLADKMGSRQLPFLLGLIALLLATILLAIGDSFSGLVVARLLQGLSAAVVWVVGLALLVETVGPENLGAVIGTIFSFMTVGGLAAPVVGGVLYKRTGYTGVFGVGLGLVALDFVMRLLVIEKKVAAQYDEEPRTSNATPAGLGIHTDGAADEATPLLAHPSSIDTHYVLIGKRNRLTRHFPILSCMRSPRLLVAFFIGFIQAVLLGAFDSTIATLAEQLFAFNSLRAGLLFLPLGITDVVIGPVAGWAVDRLGPRTVAAAGYTWLVPALVCLRFAHGGGVPAIALLCALLGLCGAGVATVNAPGLVEAGLVVDKFHAANPTLFGKAGPYAQLYGCTSSIWCLGLAVGPLMAGALKEQIGYGNMNAVLAGLCGIAAVLAWAYMGERGEEQGGYGGECAR
ncbi:uncharacterized protein K452DRAFT_247032 [Aplosporella prunicola CBS 121167]|uniref:Major facilitator superfamily (MFS) profile domain-containing protein n=1 Tax=Aplosporella prunicola CBS 121167 TaxID=1176127 RepID=A0A6A6BHV0_9PEZI|nr:uncharacterized protein K452DRAFT_247032 [Aplosporella prunicola CBS 121167]KAF2143700.1 hypothetical protein K452DRAFT_247032 [Aplosporella prunicola CBS 121167]